MTRISLLAPLPACLALLAPASSAGSGFPASVGGSVVDLTVDAGGSLLYCTREGDVGRVSTAGDVTVVATAGTGLFPQELRAVVETPSGNICVLDLVGDIYEMPGGVPPAGRLYDDRYMVIDPTDLVVDADGNFTIASSTPSNGKRGVNRVSSDGQRWSYYFVQHDPLFQPAQLAADPVTGDLLAADAAGGGRLQSMDADDPTHALCPLDTTTLFGLDVGQDDGDMAVETDGDVLLVAGGTVWRWERASGTSSVLASGFGQLHGIAIAASSGGVPSPSGWSAYVAEGAGPTAIHEIPDVGAPAPVVGDPLGAVPNRGIQRTFYGSLRVYELTADENGDLLIGGDLWGSNQSVRRLDLPSFTMTTVAGQPEGIGGRIEGITVAGDGTIFAMESGGVVYEIHESPLGVTTYYDNSQGAITAGKDLLLDRDGRLYVADREFWGGGEVRAIETDGSTTQIAQTQESRGLSANPLDGTLNVSEWVNSGFNSKVTSLDVTTGVVTDLPGFADMNVTNSAGWGDGDTVVDVEGNVYHVSEDDWSLVRWNPAQGGIVRIGSSYLSHPSGVAIAPSVASSSTGWSLYVSEFDFLWEIPDVPAPAPLLLDAQGPTVGQLVGYASPADGRPRDLIPDPAGGGFLVPTTDAKLLRMADDGAVTLLADDSQGLAGELRAAAVRSDGHVLVVNADGVVRDLDPQSGYAATTLFADPSDELQDVRGMTVDGQDRVLLVERAAGSAAGELWRLESGSLVLVAYTERGLRPAIDPLTAEVFVTQEGRSSEPGGELLRVDALVSPPAVASWRGDSYEQFGVGGFDGGIAFDDAGNFYVAEGDTGRVVRVDRATGARTDVAGGYTRPSRLALAPGTPGVAGPGGTSLFVLDGWVVWEVGVDGLPAPPPPATNPGLAPPADLRVHGLAALGTQVPVSISSAAHAGKVYVIFPSLEGHLPGFPLGALGEPSDPRIIPSNPDPTWDLIGAPSVFPGFTGTLDGTGASAPGTAIVVPNDPSVLLGAFLDLAWVVLDGSATNYVAHVGATGHLFLGP